MHAECIFAKISRAGVERAGAVFYDAHFGKRKTKMKLQQRRMSMQQVENERERKTVATGDRETTVPAGSGQLPACEHIIKIELIYVALRPPARRKRKVKDVYYAVVYYYICSYTRRRCGGAHFVPNGLRFD